MEKVRRINRAGCCSHRKKLLSDFLMMNISIALMTVSGRVLSTRDSSRWKEHDLHSGSYCSGVCLDSTKVDWIARHRVQLIRSLRWRKWRASSNPCWHMLERISGFGGKRIRMKRLMFCLLISMLVFAKFTLKRKVFECFSEGLSKSRYPYVVELWRRVTGADV